MRRNCLETRSSAVRFRGGSGGKTSETGRARERARMRTRSSSGKDASERDILGRVAWISLYTVDSADGGTTRSTQTRLLPNRAGVTG